MSQQCFLLVLESTYILLPFLYGVISLSLLYSQSLESTKIKWVSSKTLIKQGQGVIPGSWVCSAKSIVVYNPREGERETPSHWPIKQLVWIAPAHLHLHSYSPLPKTFLWIFFTQLQYDFIRTVALQYKALLLSGTDVALINWLFSFLHGHYQQMFTGHLYHYFLLELSIKIYVFPSMRLSTKNSEAMAGKGKFTFHWQSLPTHPNFTDEIMLPESSSKSLWGQQHCGIKK